MKKSSKYLLPIAFTGILVTLILFFAVPTASTPPTIIPRKVLFGNPVKTSPRLSPDGTQIAYLAPNAQDILNVWVAPIDDLAKAVLVTSDAKRGVRSYFWQWDGKAILYNQDVDGNEDWHLLQTNLQTKQTRDLTPFSGVRTDIIAYDAHHPNEILVTLNLRNPQLFDVYRIHLDTGAIALDTTNPGTVHDWIADNHMQIRASQSYTPDGGIVVAVRDTPKGSWNELMRWGPEEGMGGAVSFSPDEEALYVLSSVGSDTVRLVSVNLTTKQQQTIAQDATHDIGSILAHPTTHQLLAAGVERDRFAWIILDDSVRSDFQTIEKEAGPAFQIVNRSEDDSKWIVAARRDDQPSAFYLYDRALHHASPLFRSMPALDNYTLVPMKPVHFKARDGLEIQGYLTLPAGRTPENLPTVLLVHGGPWVRDSWGYHPAVQWLANRGYAVFQVNYRGSTGFGKAFVNAGDKEWGRNMHNDILDAKQWLVSKGVADPNKTAIYGGSYGGYATLAGLAFTPDEFCCGVDIVGPSNLLTLLNSFPPYWEPARALFSRRVGDPATEEAFLRERSPLFQADRITKPLLIAQGANDPRVKQHESDQIVTAMRLNQKPVEYLVFEDEGHGFVRPENKRRFYAAAEHFLAQHLGGSSEPAAPDEEWAIVQR